MLNRNGLFGTRDEKLEEKGKTPGMEAFGAGGTTVRTSALQDGGSTSPNTLRGAREASAAAAIPASTAVAGKAEDGPGSKLIVGPNIKLKGVEITDCDTLVVEGHVEATMDSRAIQIAQSGSFSGTVGIDVAEIRGAFSGELTVRKKLVIYSTGRVSGTVRYGKLVIEEGGELSGEIKTLSQQEQPVSAAAAPKGAAPATAQTAAQPQPAVH